MINNVNKTNTAQEYAQYTPSKGYFWQFKNETETKGCKRRTKFI